jgi:hypothetical protein
MSRVAAAIALTTSLLTVGCKPPPSSGAEEPPAGSASAAAPSACKLPGRWVAPLRSGPFQGPSIWWTIDGDGTSSSQLGATVIVKGKWEMTGSTLTTTDVSGAPSTAACPASTPGRYTVTFGPDCQTATFRVQSDGCMTRETQLNQNPFRRL